MTILALKSLLAQNGQMVRQALCLLLLVSACSPTPGSNSQGANALIAGTPVPANPEIEVRTSLRDGGKVHFIVTTNIPLPIEVMASVSLTNQQPQDMYIGSDSERMTLTRSTTEFEIEAKDQHGRTLPTGEYEGEVSYYNRWGAQNEAAKQVADVSGTGTPFRLSLTGESSDQAQNRGRQQRWVMENVISGTPWNQRDFQQRLGRFEKFPSDMSHLHDAYYFAGPDMTLLVNRLRGEVTVWRFGRKSS